MLRFVEEILLLMGDESTTASMPVLLAGALLMDLALENRIDNDQERVMLIDATPVGDDLLDPVLAEIAAESEPRSIDYWLTRTAASAEDVRERALNRLVERGILESDQSAMFSLTSRVSRSRRYPVIDGSVVEEVQFRIMRLLFSDDIPDPRDTVIVSLAAAGDVFRRNLSQEELAEVRERIDLIGGMELIGQSVARAVRQAEPPPVPAVRPAVEIPRADGLPIVGNAFDMAGDLRDFLTRQYLQLGPIFQVRAFNSRFIVLAGPEANIFVQKNGRAFLRSYETWNGFNSDMGARNTLIGMDGQDHFRMRKVHRRAFSGRYIQDRMGRIIEITERIIADWPEGSSVVCQQAMQTIIAEQIAVLTTGVSALKHIDDLLTTLDGLLSVHLTNQRPGLILRLPRMRRARRGMEELYAMVMAHHEGERAVEGRDLIDDLLELHENDPQLLPETDLQLAVLGPFFAGIETAANTASFMLYALLKHPDLLSELTAEADTFFESDATVEGLHGLDVTRRIFMETLRMYPVIPGLTRTVANSFEFGGYTVPARSKVIVGNTVAHQLPQCFPNPERFDIERFTPERAEHRQRGAFEPFGLGTHRCLGANFAEVQVMLTLLTIAHHLQIGLDPPNYKLKIKNTPTPHPHKSFRFRVTSRRK